MTGKVYCYHCMTYHHPEAMRKIVTRAGERWRCIRSIEAAQTGAAERKAFGERQSELNRARSRAINERSMSERCRPAFFY